MWKYLCKKNVNISYNWLYFYPLKERILMLPNEILLMHVTCSIFLQILIKILYKGRYENTEYNYRFCKECKEEIIDTLRHNLFVCKAYNNLRE